VTAGREGDTTADALAAAVRRIRPLSPVDLVALVGLARMDPDGPPAARLIEHHLGLALDAAIARGGAAATLEDLFQEASLAVVTGVQDFLRGPDEPSALRGRLEVAVRRHIEARLLPLESLRRDERHFARDAELMERTVSGLHGRLGHSPTAEDLAAALEWPPERVAIVSTFISMARARNDEEISLYLDEDG